MNKVFAVVAVLAFSVLAQAYVPSTEAKLVQKFEKDGYIYEVYMQETYADDTQYCSQQITLKYEADTKKLVSSSSKELCTRMP